MVWSELDVLMRPHESDFRAARAELRPRGFAAWWPAWEQWPARAAGNPVAPPERIVEIFLNGGLAISGHLGGAARAAALQGYLIDPDQVARLCEVIEAVVLASIINDVRLDSPWSAERPELAGALAIVAAQRVRIESPHAWNDDEFAIRLAWRVYSIRLVHILVSGDDTALMHFEISWLLRRFCQQTEAYRRLVAQVAATGGGFDVDVEIGREIDGALAGVFGPYRRPTIDAWVRHAQKLAHPETFTINLWKDGARQVMDRVNERLRVRLKHYAPRSITVVDGLPVNRHETESGDEERPHPPELEWHLDETATAARNLGAMIAILSEEGFPPWDALLLILIDTAYEESFLERERLGHVGGGQPQVANIVADWINAWRASVAALRDWVDRFGFGPRETAEALMSLLLHWTDRLFPPGEGPVTSGGVIEKRRLIRLRLDDRLRYIVLEPAALRTEPGGKLICEVPEDEFVVQRGDAKFTRNAWWAPVAWEISVIGRQPTGWMAVEFLQLASDYPGQAERQAL